MRIKVNPGVAWQALALCGRQSATATQRLRQAATATAAAMAKLRYVLWIVLQHFRRSLPSYTDSCRQWSDAPAIAHSTYPPPELYLWLYPFPYPLPLPLCWHIKGKAAVASRLWFVSRTCGIIYWRLRHTQQHSYTHTPTHTHNSIRTRGCLAGGRGRGGWQVFNSCQWLEPLLCFGLLRHFCCCHKQERHGGGEGRDAAWLMPHCGMARIAF